MSGQGTALAAAWASEDRLVTVGVLTITSKEEAKARWNATADYLSHQVEGTRFEIRPLYLQEIARAVRQNELDFVHLQPLQFVQLRRRHDLTALATRVIDDTGDGMNRFGSVIVRHRDRTDIDELRDLRGAIIAGVAPNALGAWILGMAEIERAGLSLEDDVLPLFVGLPMNNVLGAVVAGRADAGIVRSDVLARAIETETYPADTFVVLDPVNQPGYPHPVSTRLVPEWPFAATSRPDEGLVAQVRTALLSLPRQAPPVQAAGLVGWTEPASYDGLETMADRWLTPPQTLEDWLRANWWVIPVALSGLLALLLGQQWRARRKLAGREREHRAALNAMRDAVVTLDPRGRIQFMNPAAERLLTEDMPPSRAQGRHFLDAFALLLRHDHHDFSLGGLYERLNRDGWVEYPVVLAHGHPSRILDLNAIRMDGRTEGPVREVLVSMTDVTELVDANRQLAYRASHDELSGLLNRRSFIQFVDRRLSSDSSARTYDGGVVLWLDLDHFRLINEGGSHGIGDELVRRMASYLGVLLPAGTPIGRLGDDEFGIFLADDMTPDWQEWPDRVLEAVRAFRMGDGDQMLRVTASIGARVLPADLNIDAASALQEAESACLIAKHLGGNRLVTYEEGESERALRQADFAELNRLKEALEKDRFVLHGQEIHSLATDCDGPWLEVLLRLDGGEGEYESPGPMIELAERFNYMPPVDRWVINNAFRMLQRHLGSSSSPPARLTVNLSGQSMKDGELASYVRDELNRSAIEPDWICFEVTETAAIANFDQALELIAALRDLGCMVALDDFGGGLLSFDFLRRLQPDIVKIDGKLVSDIESDPVAAVIVESIHSVARVMGAKTVGEWVENASTRSSLASIGVDFAQGYLFHRPVPLDGYLVDARTTTSG
ncbi:EAL domain-containing protein [Guyparkeria hydrothermalis]|uniref:EAL domain-containing protein n=1 Tax=Guyparkeria hydrothermalis TaxID=923 RepID=UPI0020228B23|nr:EAL domain-containing protein [Guyparkeria hydrothermalis]MCL7743914.1 EAL domain-containing protein [Guyparkeria hydrothermalis]